MPADFYKPAEQNRTFHESPPPDPGMLARVEVSSDNANRLESIPVKPEWGYEQHLYTNTSGAKKYAGERLYIDTDVLDASPSNPVPITTYDGDVLDVDESRTDHYDITYAHSLLGGRA